MIEIEVFKTTVQSHDHATALLEVIHSFYPAYQANFDLQDCDNILRIKYERGIDFNPTAIIDLVAFYGYQAEVLEDQVAGTLR